jgi:hypothetical protein
MRCIHIVLLRSSWTIRPGMTQAVGRRLVIPRVHRCSSRLWILHPSIMLPFGQLEYQSSGTRIHVSHVPLNTACETQIAPQGWVFHREHGSVGLTISPAGISGKQPVRRLHPRVRLVSWALTWVAVIAPYFAPTYSAAVSILKDMPSIQPPPLSSVEFPTSAGTGSKVKSSFVKLS